MSERKIASIVWRQYAPGQIEVRYADGETEHVAGTHADAARMAAAADMRATTAPLGMVRWDRGATAKDGRTPKRIGPWLSS